MDGDSAAAYRYTEAKMTRLAEFMLADIEKETVDFRDNFDCNICQKNIEYSIGVFENNLFNKFSSYIKA